MQTIVNTKTITNEGKTISDLSRTATHQNHMIKKYAMSPLGIGGIGSPVVYGLDARSTGYSIISNPGALLNIKAKRGNSVSVTVATYNAVMHGLLPEELEVYSMGNIKSVYPVTGMSVANGKTKFTIDGRVNGCKLIGAQFNGPVRVNGEYIYMIMGNYSEQKIYLTDVGKLDKNGDKYPYPDPEGQEMVETEKDFGYYVVTMPKQIAEALERCINEAYYEKVVEVEYTGGRLVITALNAIINTINIVNDFESIASDIGFNGTQYTIPATDIQNNVITFPGTENTYDIYAAAGEEITINADLTGETVSMLYVLEDKETNMTIAEW